MGPWRVRSSTRTSSRWTTDCDPRDMHYALRVFAFAVVLVGCADSSVPPHSSTDDAGHGDASAAVDAGAGEPLGDPSVEPPRLVFPPSTSRVTTRRPELRWELGPDTDGVLVELCRDRTCADPIERLQATGSTAQPTEDLPKGTVFWRAFGRSAEARGQRASATWSMTIRTATTTVDTAWGSVVDPNDDGYADVVVAAEGSEKVYVLAGSASGLSTEPAARLTDPDSTMRSGYGSRLMSAGDVDGDGFGDVMIGDPQRLNVYHGTAAGLEAAPRSTIIFSTTSSTNGSFGAAGDVDGDGFGDVVLTNGSRHFGGEKGGMFTVLWFRGGASGLANTPSATLMGPSDSPIADGLGGGAVAIGDVNGDRYADVVIHAGDGRETALYVALGSATGPSPAPHRVAIASHDEGAPRSEAALTVGDFDGDGYADAALAYSYTDATVTVAQTSVFVRFGGAGGLSERGSQVAVAPQYAQPTMLADDFLGDGRDTLVVGWVVRATTGCDAATVSTVRAGAAGDLQPAAVTAPTGAEGACFGASFARGDVNGDGNSDLVVGAPGAASNAGMLYVIAGGASFPALDADIRTGPDGINGRFGNRFAN
jgi:hypothetical protein